MRLLEKPTALVARSWFDGERLHQTPVTLLLNSGRIDSLEAGDQSASLPAGTEVLRSGFVMPGLVDAHVHLFLDGGELDFKARTAYLKGEPETMLPVARANLQRSTASGVTLVRDAGDRYGINDTIRAEVRAAGPSLIGVRSPGLGIRRPERYGSFMAREVCTDDEIRATVREIAAQADDLKIILTGIIDFEAGCVKGEPQFDAAALTLIVNEAHDQGLKTFAHCSGEAGLQVAVQAGVDSIEHGFFMTHQILDGMAAKGIAWVPTFSPVHFQWACPELAGWSAQTIDNLRSILDSHSASVAEAVKRGVNLVAGSDAGSHGVVHGVALIDELAHFRAAGVGLEEVLRTATSRPRRLWGIGDGVLKTGAESDLVAYNVSPVEDIDALRAPQWVLRGAAINDT